MKMQSHAAMVALLASTALAQHAPPPVDMRPAEVRRDAIVGATIIVRPGEVIEDGVILLRDGMIESIGAGLDVPAGYRQHDHHGLFVYPGLIDLPLRSIPRVLEPLPAREWEPTGTRTSRPKSP